MSLLSPLLGFIRRRRPAVAAAAAMALALGGLVGTTTGTAHAAGTLLSQGKPATASSTENAGTPASAAVDGDTGTRWSSAVADPQWLQVDLGATATVTLGGRSTGRPRTRTAFQIQVSDDAQTWTDDLLHHHRHRRHADAHRKRFRALCPDVRHRPRHRLRLLPVGVPGLRHGRRRRRPAAARTNAALRTGRRPPPPPRTPAPRPRPRSTATPAPAGRARPPTRSGSRSTSAPRRPICQVVLNWESAYATAFQIQVSGDAADLDRRSTPPPPAPAAPRRSTSAAPAGTCGCTARPAPPDTATRCGSSQVHTGGAHHRPAARRRHHRRHRRRAAATSPVPSSPRSSRSPRPRTRAATPRPPRSTAGPPPAGRACTPTRSGSRSTSAASARSAASC